MSEQEPFGWDDLLDYVRRTFVAHKGHERLINRIREEGLAESPLAILRSLIDRPTSAHTRFFRNQNLEVFAKQVAPALLQTLGRTSLNIAEVGCGGGQESWSLAAHLTLAGVPFQLNAFESSGQDIDHARQGDYKKTVFMASHPPEAALPLFDIEDDPDGWVSPGNELKQRVTFGQHNALLSPIPGGPYDVVVINNVLYHYQTEPRNAIMRHLLGGLVVGGAFVYEARSLIYNPGYKPWRDSLEEQFGLVPAPEAGSLSDQIRYYQPKPPKPVLLPPSRELPSPISGDSIVQQIGSQLVRTTTELPFAGLRAGFDSLTASQNTFAGLSEMSVRLPDVNEGLAAACQKLADAATSMNTVVDQTSTYITEVLGLSFDNR